MKYIEIHGQTVAMDEFLPDPASSNPPWILIHGAGHDHGVWTELALGLSAAGEHLIAPDLPGHGHSGGAPIADIAGMAAWVLALADVLGHAQLRLCGHSMGSLVALAAAGAAPQRVRQLALVGTAVPMPVSPLLLNLAQNDPDQAYALINKYSFAPLEVLGASRRQALAAANLQRMQQQGGAVLANDLAACNAWQDGLSAAAQVRCPTTIISGELDRMTPVDAVISLLDTLDKACGDTRMAVLAGSSHSIMQEVPEALLETLREPS